MKRKTQNKKIEERIILRYFSSVYPEFPKGRIVETESPDFSVALSTRSATGIELTRLTRSDHVRKDHNTHPASTQANHEFSGNSPYNRQASHSIHVNSLERIICRQARRLYLNKTSLPLFVSVYFQNGNTLEDAAIMDTAAAIVADLEAVTQGMDTGVKQSVQILKPVSPLVEFIYATYLPGIRVSWWENAGDHLVPSLSKDYLEEIIRAKEQKLPLYRKKRFDQYWLIIYADSFARSVSFHVSNQLEAWNIQSEFHQVFLFERMNFRVYSL